MTTSENKKRTSEFDTRIGARVRLARTIAGISQEKLGNSLDLTFQQIQKYERGTNRISAGRLVAIAATLGVPISYFYEGTDYNGDSTVTVAPELTKPDCIRVARNFDRITKPGVKRAIAHLLSAAAGEEAEPVDA